MLKRKKSKIERWDWEDYELQVLKIYRDLYPAKIVLENRKHKGRHSGKLRQVDVAVYSDYRAKKLYAIIECKNISRKVSLTYLDALVSKMDELNVKKAAIVTNKGFSDGVKTYAAKKKIDLKQVNYEYLKDYYYIPPSQVPEVFMKATRYATPYCDTCDISILYEIGEVYGMADHEVLQCPKCKQELMGVRSDANHRVIKLFEGNRVSKKEKEEVKARHIFLTREEWLSWIYGDREYGLELDSEKHCFLCKSEFEHPTHHKLRHRGKNVCSECMMSERTLLIDYKYL